MYSTFYNKEEKLWYGPNVPAFYNPKISLAHVFFDSMLTFGSKVAQISDDTGNRMTFSEIHKKSVCAAQNLQALGYQPKQVIGMIALNSHLVAPIALACVAIGCPIINLHPSFKKAQALHMLRLTEPVVMFCDVNCYELIKECFEELENPAKIFTFGGSVGDSESVESLFHENHDGRSFIPANVDGENDTVLLVCTSGTTGQPKVVRWSHAALLDELCVFSQILTADDVMLSFASLYFAGSLVLLMRSTLYGQTRIISTENFSPEMGFRIIEQYGVTCAFVVPFQLIRMLRTNRMKKVNLSSWKWAILVGGSLPHSTKCKFEEQLPNGYVVSTYGMSELAGPMSFDYPSSGKVDTSGRLVAGCCVKIVDKDENRCGIGESGEVRLKMHLKYSGYFKNKAATDDVFDEEGFLVTGDLGYFDEDGDLFISGRRKDIIKYAGFNISPAEIDAFLYECPGVRAACVVGVPDPAGDLPTAFVVRQSGATISKKQIYDMVAGHFADHYKLRGGIFFVDSLPTTSSSKLVRRKVKEMAMERLGLKK